MTWKFWKSKIHYFNGIHYCLGLTRTCICCSLFFISVNFCFSFVSNSLTYITIPKNNHGKIKINWNKKLTTTYMIQCIIICICEGGLGKILTCNMALKQWHKTRRNGDKQHKDGLNTERDMAYSSTYTTPLPKQGLHVNECGLTCICTSHIQNALLEYKINKAIDEVSYLMHMTYTTSIKQQTFCESGFSWVYMSRYTNISDRWDILLFNTRKLKETTLSKIYLHI